METNELLEQATYVMETIREEAAASEDFIPDEIAICFVDEASLVRVVKELADDYGLEHFNSVERDTMRRLDRLGEGFDVRFEFLRLPGRDWRFECMVVLEGIAPLHMKALQDSGGEPTIIHYSYKMNNLDEYSQLMRDMPTRTAMSRRAEYHNTYGIFSYWMGSGGHIYEKPRVNLRD
jgi:hypothetical protein